jgi:hypothetical protein
MEERAHERLAAGRKGTNCRLYTPPRQHSTFLLGRLVTSREIWLLLVSLLLRDTHPCFFPRTTPKVHDTFHGSLLMITLRLTLDLGTCFQDLRPPVVGAGAGNLGAGWESDERVPLGFMCQAKNVRGSAFPGWAMWHAKRWTMEYLQAQFIRM